jgi:hypothetical protein
MLKGSHMGPTHVVSWGGSPATGQTSMWPPPLPPARYWPPPPLASHTGQSSNTPPPPSGHRYWPPPWAPIAGGQAPPWGMPLWMTPTLQPQPQRPSSSPPTVRHLCLLSIVTFVIQANIERLTNSFIYVFN